MPTIAFRHVARLVVLTGFTASAGAFAQQSSNDAPPPGDHPHGPPPEAFAACASKAVNDTCSFTGHKDNTITGQCVAPRKAPAATDANGGSKLVCRPQRKHDDAKQGG